MEKKYPLGKIYVGNMDIVLKHLTKAIESRWLSGGPVIEEFEQAIKTYNNDDKGHYVSVANCTVALEKALEYHITFLHNKGEDINIIIPSWSWVATSFAAFNCLYRALTKNIQAAGINIGINVSFVDVNKYGVIDADILEKNIIPNPETSNIAIIVHQMGVCCDMDKINALKAKYNLSIIEDAACALGSEYKGVKIGVSDNTVCYSFQARKCLTTGGEGGMIVTRNDHEADWYKSQRAFGTNSTPLQRARSAEFAIERFEDVGTNYKLSGVQAAYGLAHLEYFDEERAKRKQIFEWYEKHLDKKYFTMLPYMPEYQTAHSYQNFHIYLEGACEELRNQFLQELKNQGIQGKWDIQPMHKEPCVESMFPETDNNPSILLENSNTKFFAKNCFWLPLYADLVEEDVEYICSKAKEVYEKICVEGKNA